MRGRSDGKDEMYCEWFVCTKCGSNKIAEFYKFCPSCGADATPAPPVADEAERMKRNAMINDRVKEVLPDLYSVAKRLNSLYHELVPAAVDTGHSGMVTDEIDKVYYATNNIMDNLRLIRDVRNEHEL